MPINDLEDKIKELYNSGQFLRAIVDSSLDGITVLNEHGKFEYVNNSFLRITGWPEEEIIGQCFFQMIPEEEKEFVKKHWKGIQTDQGGNHEIKIITRSGILKYLNVSSSFVDINGKNKIIAVVHDISEVKKNVIDLKESEAKYRELFDHASDCIYTINLDGQFLTINSSLIRAMKCDSVEEILASNMSKWMTPESLENTIKFMQEVITEEDYYNKSVAIEIIRKDGKHVWFEHKARPIKDNNNNVIGLHGIGRDITEKIRLEQELKESEEKYRDLFENAQDAMYVLDNDLNFLKMNKIGIEILGCIKEEVIGTNISKWVTPESLGIINERKKKRLSGEKVSPTDILEIVGKNGEHKWVEIRSRVIMSEDSIIEYHGIARDITENRLLKQELNKSNKQQKLLCHLIQGTRGGKTRALILKHISDKSYNANELAIALNKDYKTVRHHIKILTKNGIIGKSNNGSYDLYYILNDINMNLNG